MTDIEFKTLKTWPRSFRTEHYSDQFRSSLGDTISKLSEELRMVGATTGEVCALFESGSLRANGTPSARARVSYPGVLVRFTNGNGLAVEIGTDKYIAWESNLRGIVLSLEDLRGINRHGCSEQDQQYLGFPALPPPDADTLDTAEDAAGFVARLVDTNAADTLAETLLQSPAMFKVLFADLRKKAHPDQRDGAGHDEFIKLEKAGQLLREHYTQNG